MGVRLYGVVIDSTEPKRLAEWWAQALGWQIVFEAPEEVAVARDENTHPGLVFVPVPESKSGKNRLHLDLAPDDRDSEVARLEALGARRVDVGQTRDNTWVVLADPEGNEFCVLSAREGGV